MAQKGSQVKNVVLVHGAWADGSSWSDVIEKLQDKGYKVTAPQFPMSSLANDVARLRQVLALQERMFAKRMRATVVEVKSSHVAMTSHPKETVELIEKAAAAATSK
jgi:pimeloyl-ACP methyl ester carboxylesterase